MGNRGFRASASTLVLLMACATEGRAQTAEPPAPEDAPRPVEPAAAPPSNESPPVEPTAAPAPEPFEAQPSEAVPGEDEFPNRRHRLGLDLTFYTQSPTGGHITVLAPIIRGAFWFGPVTLEADVPFVYYDVGASAQGFFAGGGDSGFLPGNPSLAVKYHVPAERTDVYVGAGLTLPIASIQGDQNGIWKAAGYGAAIGTRGGWNAWLYYPESLALFLPVGVRHVTRQGLDVGVEAAAALFIYTGDGSRDPLGFGQFGAHVGYAASFIESGLRIRGVRLAGDTRDNFQFSLEPYVTGILGNAYVGAGLIMNVDQPLGPFFDTGSVWGLRIEGGARF